MSTNLNTLKAKVSAVIRDCEIDPEQNCNVLSSAEENGAKTFFLKARLIEKIAELMQRHEVWCLGQKPLNNMEYQNPLPV